MCRYSLHSEAKLDNSFLTACLFDMLCIPGQYGLDPTSFHGHDAQPVCVPYIPSSTLVSPEVKLVYLADEAKDGLPKLAKLDPQCTLEPAFFHCCETLDFIV